MNPLPDEPAIPPRLRRPLAAMWISLGLHAAVLALVQVAPPAATPGGHVIEARLVVTHAEPPAAATPPMASADDAREQAPEVPLLAPSEAAEALPVAEPVAPPPVQAEPTAAPAAPPPAAPAPSAALVPDSSAAPAPDPAGAISSAVDLTYYSARELDVQPRALHRIEPVYPAEADRRRLSGTLRLQLKLEADGRVSDIEVVSADPPGLFEESALDAFRDARFAPAQRAGRPVRARVVIEVVYDWDGQSD